jgi:hypothetical protein
MVSSVELTRDVTVRQPSRSHAFLERSLAPGSAAAGVGEL